MPSFATSVISFITLSGFLLLILGINEKNDIVEYVEQASKNTYVSDVLHQTEFLDFGDVTYTEKRIEPNIHTNR